MPPGGRRMKLEIDFVRGFWTETGNMAVLDVENLAFTKFSISIDSGISLAKKLMVLAHEMTHIRQYIQGDMRSSSRGIGWTIWKGEMFEEATLDYFNAPWEIEAFGREYGLFIRFTEAFGYTKRNWSQVD